MNTNKMINKSARAIGVLILVLSSLALGAPTGTDTIDCYLRGADLTYNYTTDPVLSMTATPINSTYTGGGTKNCNLNVPKTYFCRFITSAPWVGKIHIIGAGYIINFDSLKESIIPSIYDSVKMFHDTLSDHDFLNKKVTLYFTATKIITSVRGNRIVPIVKDNQTAVFFDLSGKKISSNKVSTLAVSKNQTRLIGLFGKR